MAMLATHTMLVNHVENLCMSGNVFVVSSCAYHVHHDIHVLMDSCVKLYLLVLTDSEDKMSSERG